MGCRHTIDQGVTHVVFEGSHELADELGVLRSAPSDLGLLIDIRASERIWKSEDARRLAELLGGKSLSGRCAVVVADNVQYGVARMFAAQAEFLGVAPSIFRDGGEAVKWLRSGPRSPA